MYLKNKNILITGAGKGIGENSVKNFTDNGAYVYALIKNKKDNSKFSKIKNIKIFNGDASDKTLIKKILNFSIKEKKIINCIVNNAGVRLRKKFLAVSDNEIKNVFKTNFFSVFNITQIFSKFWVQKKIKGNIVNIASIVGQVGFDELTVYASSKGALISLTKSLATELSKYGIRSNSISPGFTKTSFYEKFKKKNKLHKWTISRIPQKRWGEPNEISNAIAFLLSDECKYINGENINVDGGWISS
jgi:NAD(P)-dependent dehydrogenase (short-subunit alcohol dehydrogenase family)